MLCIQCTNNPCRKKSIGSQRSKIKMQKGEPIKKEHNTQYTIHNTQYTIHNQTIFKKSPVGKNHRVLQEYNEAIPVGKNPK